MGIIGTIIIGFIAGLIAKWLKGGPNAPEGFILTTLLGIAGAFVFTWLGQQLGFYDMGESAGFIGSIIGAILVLMVWGSISKRA
ncbi:MAG: GlsB/YeaQ/YmgE family stress response membrane protein [Pseudomonadota bacterium]